MSDSGTTDNRGGGAQAVIIGVLVALVLYVGAPVLVIAPIMDIHPGAKSTLKLLFAPVIWLYDNSEIYEGYIDYQGELAEKIGLGKV